MSTEIWGRCPACDHTWRASHVPQRMCDLVTQLRDRANCPQCYARGLITRAFTLAKPRAPHGLQESAS